MATASMLYISMRLHRVRECSDTSTETLMADSLTPWSDVHCSFAALALIIIILSEALAAIRHTSP